MKKIVPSESLEVVAAAVIREKATASTSTSTTDPVSLKTMGRPTKVLKVERSVTRKLKKAESSIISHEQVDNARMRANLSQRQTETILNEFRSTVQVEGYVSEHMKDMNKTYSDYFSVCVEEFDGVKVPMVFCNDTVGFFNKIVESRGGTFGDFILRLNIDDGQSFLKLSAALVYRQKDEEKGRFLSTGVKRTFLLAVAPVKETYSNIRRLLEKINLDLLPDELEELYCQDLKACNVTLGLGSHRSKRPCLYCLWKVDS